MSDHTAALRQELRREWQGHLARIEGVIALLEKGDAVVHTAGLTDAEATKRSLTEWGRWRTEMKSLLAEHPAAV